MGISIHTAWAEKIGIKLEPTGEGPEGAFRIEHPDGTKGTIERSAVMTAALMSIRGEADRALRYFMYDNTVQRERG